jgi:hypothetical protein
LNRINILIAVDVVGALAAGTLQGYVYLVDTNKYLGSWQEGQSTLNTVCQDGQLLTWCVTSVDPGNDVEIAGFSGAMVDGRICLPAQDPIAGNTVWNARVESQGAFASYPYSVTLAMSGQSMAFSSFLKVV